MLQWIGFSFYSLILLDKGNSMKRLIALLISLTIFMVIPFLLLEKGIIGKDLMLFSNICFVISIMFFRLIPKE
mgnify:CR=1 FL=1